MSEKQENNHECKENVIVESLAVIVKELFDTVREDFREKPNYIRIEDVDEELFENFMDVYKDKFPDELNEEIKNKKDLIMYLVGYNQLYFFEKGFSNAFMYIGETLNLTNRIKYTIDTNNKQTSSVTSG